MSALERYDFLVLALACLVPSAIVYARRPDLRGPMRRMALASLPFALTERLFYRTYWTPQFLGDLIAVLGFGVEDVLFVVGLAGFTSTAYPFALGRRLAPDPRGRPSAGAAVGLLLAVLGGAVAAHALGVPMIYACLGAMAVGVCALVARRPELARPAIVGGALSTVVYGGICLVYGAALPGVFARVWHTERFFARFVAGVPLEEFLYGFASGAIATVFLPTVLGLRFVDAGAPALTRG